MTGDRFNSSANGERDRPDRTSRRPADWSRAPQISLNRSTVRPPDVFGGTPKTAGETPAIPMQSEVRA
jgi:hypothetical protein